MVVCAVATSPARAATTAVVLSPGQVAEAASQGTAPSDGRLRGEDFTAAVSQVAWPQSVQSTSGVDYVAGSGRRLVTFTVAVTQPTDDSGLLNAATGVSAALKVGAASLPVSMTRINQEIASGTGGSAETTGTDSFVASVPAATHSVDLLLTEARFSQSFDLWTLKRLPPSPTILYRDPSSSTVTGTAAASFRLAFTNPADGYSSSDDDKVSSAALTWFAPDGSGTTPGNPSEAFLVVGLQSSYPSVPYGQPNSGHFFSSFTPLPGNRLTFTPTGGSAVTGTSSNSAFSSTNAASDDDGIFDALYWFSVPATTTGGTLTVTAGPATGTEYTGFTGSGNAVPIDVTAPANVSLSFPAVPSAPVAQRTPPWVGAPLPATGLAAAPNSAASSSGTDAPTDSPFPIWAGVLALLGVIALGVAVDQVRRRRRPATAVPTGVPPPLDAIPEVPAQAAGVAPSPPVDDGLFHFDALGPPLSSGWREEPDGELLREIAGFLAFQERPVSLDEIALALWPTGGPRGEPNRASLHTYMSRLRKAVGKDRLSDANAGRGYKLSDYVTDWGRFQALCTRAEGAGGSESTALRKEALGLVRGEPFASVAPGQFGWAFESNLVDRMIVAITGCAHALAEQCMTMGDNEGARWAAERGLVVSRTEEQLLADLWRIAVLADDPSEQRRVRARIASLLGPEAAERICGP